MDDDLAHLIEHGRRRRVHQRGEQRHLDDGPVALGDRDQARDVGAIEVGERHPMDARDLGGIRDERRARTAPDDHGGDDEARARAVVVEQPEDRGLVALEPDLFPELAERRALGALARVDPASGQRPLSRVGAERCSATGQEEARASLVVVQQHEGDRRRAAAVARERPPLEGGEVGARPRA